MEALIIVHTERDHLDHRLVGKGQAERNKALFDSIVAVLPPHLDRGGRFYYAAEAAESPSSKWIYAPLRDYFAPIIHPSGQFFPHGESFEEQSIKIKERLMEDEADNSYIVGISYRADLLPLQRFLTGDVARLGRNEFEEAWEYLGKPAARFERFYKHHLAAEIKEELTDKV